MLSSVTPAGSAAVQRKATALDHPPAFPVPVRVLGPSLAPAIPRQVGNWWPEPLRPATSLPPRARRRLQAVLAAGVVPRAVVFPELPASAAGSLLRHPAALVPVDPCLVVVTGDGWWLEVDRWVA